MADSIVRNSTPTVPIANIRFVLNDYETALKVENILHPVLNGAGHNITWKPTRNRAGTLTVLFATAAHAWAAVALLRTSYTFTLTADVPELSMTFAVRPGDLKPRNEQTFKVWLLDVPFQDVTP